MDAKQNESTGMPPVDSPNSQGAPPPYPAQPAAYQPPPLPGTVAYQQGPPPPQGTVAYQQGPPPPPGTVAYQQGPPPPPGTVAYQPGQQHVVVQQPGGFPAKPRFDNNPQQMICMYCHADIVTATDTKIGMFNWMVAGGVCLVGLGFPLLWLGCQCIPLCISSLKDVVHTCPNCHKELGVRERAS